MPKLSQKMIDTTIAPASGQVFYRDDELPDYLAKCSRCRTRECYAAAAAWLARCYDRAHKAGEND